MAKVKVYIGATELLNKVESDIEGTDVRHYVQVYDSIVSAIHADEILRVNVSNQTVGTWLSTLEDRYGPEKHIDRKAHL